MYRNTSEEYNRIIADSGRTLKARLVQGANEITDIRSFTIYRAANGEDNVGIGGAVAGYVSCVIGNTDLKLEDVEYELQIGLKMADGSYEYVPMGFYTPKKPKVQSEVTSFTAYDRMYKGFQGGYFSNIEVYPVDAKVILKEIEEMTGIPINYASLPNGVMIDRRAVLTDNTTDAEGEVVQSTKYEKPFTGYRYQEAICYIAQLYGKFAIMNRQGAVDFVWYSDSGLEYTRSQYKDDQELSESDFVLGCIKNSVGEQVLISGAGSCGIGISNPVMTQSRLDAVYNAIGGFTCKGISFSAIGNPCIDIGDVITIQTLDGEVKVPVMKYELQYDGGIGQKIYSYGNTSEESMDVPKGPTAERIDRLYNELLLVKEVVAGKLAVNNLEAKMAKLGYASINELAVEVAKMGYMTADVADLKYATIDLSNIATGAIKTAMIDVGAIGTAQIADGSITDAKIVELTANKITAGVLSVERLEIRGTENSIVYALNNITGALQAQNVDTLNGEILTERTITADKIVANAITANEIESKTITANEIAVGTITSAEIAAGTIKANNIAAATITGEQIAAQTIKAFNIDVDNLFAQDITATGTITGAEIIGANGEFTKGFKVEVHHNILTGEIYDTSPNVYADGTYGKKLFSINPTSDFYTIEAMIEAYTNNTVTTWNNTWVEIGRGFNVLYDDSDSYQSRFMVDAAITMETSKYVQIIGGQGLNVVTGEVSAPKFTANNDWYYSHGNSGWYHADYGGGIYMTDSTYVRVYNGKAFVSDSVIVGQRFASGYDGGQGGAMYCTNWFRSVNQTGWYNDSYGGGIWMADSSYLRTYGSKTFLIENFSMFGQLEMLYAGFNVIFRNDGTYFYILPGNTGGWTATTWYMDTKGRTFMTNGFIARTNTYMMSLSSDQFLRCYDSSLNSCDGVMRVGSPNYRMGQIYSTNAAISTSDRNMKKDINSLDDRYIKFFMMLAPVSFQFKDGSSGRTHIGFIAQDVEEAMISCGLSDLDFAGFCKDKKRICHENADGTQWYEDVLDEEGNVQYIYSLRYEEFIALTAMVVQKCYAAIFGDVVAN